MMRWAQWGVAAVLFAVCATECNAETLILKNGGSVFGKIQRRTKEYVILKVGEDGLVRIPIEDIDFEKTQGGCYMVGVAEEEPAKVPIDVTPVATDTDKLPVDVTPDDVPVKPLPADPAPQDLSGSGISEDVMRRARILLSSVASGDKGEMEVRAELVQMAEEHYGSLFALAADQEHPVAAGGLLNGVLAAYPADAAAQWLNSALQKQWLSFQVAVSALPLLEANSRFFPVILPKLADQDVEVRRLVSRVGSMILRQNPNSLAVVREQMRDGSALFNGEAILMVAGSKADATEEFLRGFLTDAQPAVCRINALKGLQMQGGFGSRTVDSVVKLLDSSDDATRAMAASALKYSSDLGMIPVLMDYLDDSDTKVVEAAHSTLIFLSNQNLAKDVDLWSNWWDNTGVQLLEQLEKAVDDFYAASDPTDQTKAVYALATFVKFLGKDLTVEIRDLLSEDNDQLKAAVCGFLKAKQDFDAIPDLIELLADSDKGVQQMALDALVAISGKNYPPDQTVWLEWWEKFDIMTGMAYEPVDAIRKYEDGK